MATTPTNLTFRVTNITESGISRINVGFVQVIQGSSDTVPHEVAHFASALTLNLSAEEGKAYYPGQTYTLTLAPTT